MANLDAIVRELQQERDRLDAAINALTSLSGNTLRASRTGHTSRSPQADCCRTTGEMRSGRAPRIERLRAQDQAPHLRGRSGANQGGGTGTMGEGQGGEEVSVASKIEEPHTTPEDILNE